MSKSLPPCSGAACLRHTAALEGCPLRQAIMYCPLPTVPLTTCRLHTCAMTKLHIDMPN